MLGKPFSFGDIVIWGFSSLSPGMRGVGSTEWGFDITSRPIVLYREMLGLPLWFTSRPSVLLCPARICTDHSLFSLAAYLDSSQERGSEFCRRTVAWWRSKTRVVETGEAPMSILGFHLLGRLLSLR